MDKIMYRPEIKKENFDKLNQLSNQINIASNELVNMFVKIGIDALSNTAEKLKIDFETKVKTKITESIKK